jgi:type I restriction enzyme S subunit
MAGEWRRVRLGDVAEINPDSINSAWPYSHIRYIDISSVGEGILIEPPQVMSLAEAPSRAKRLVQEGDTVLSTVRPGRRSMFYVKRAEPDLVVSTGFAVLRPRKDCIEPRYLYACVYDKAFTEFLVKREKGAAYPAVLPEDIADAMINLPPLSEQRAIAHILGTLDDKIELNRRMSETLEQMARAIFKAWFVDFEPVRAKMEGRWRRGQSLPGLPAHLYDLFPDRLVHSELGEIPEGWKITSVNDEATIVKGVSYRSQDLSESDTALVTLKSINRGGGYRYDGLKAYNGTYTREQVIHPGDVIVAQTDVTQAGEVIGKPALVMPDLRYRVLVASLDVLVVRPRRRDPPREFFYLLFLTPQFQHHVRGYINGTTVLHLNKDALTGFRFASPPEQAMKVFAAIVGALFNQVLTLARETLALTDLRDALLPKLISGKLRVKDAAKFLDRAGIC